MPPTRWGRRRVGADTIIRHQEVALALAGKEALGSFGLVLVTIAAAFSTGSAINSTLFATARLSLVVARGGELPAYLLSLLVLLAILDRHWLSAMRAGDRLARSVLGGGLRSAALAVHLSVVRRLRSRAGHRWLDRIRFGCERLECCGTAAFDSRRQSSREPTGLSARSPSSCSWQSSVAPGCCAT